MQVFILIPIIPWTGKRKGWRVGSYTSCGWWLVVVLLFLFEKSSSKKRDPFI